MDADRNPDLVVVQQYIGQPQGRVTTLRGDGAGGFTVMTPAPVGQSPRGGLWAISTATAPWTWSRAARWRTPSPSLRPGRWQLRSADDHGHRRRGLLHDAGALQRGQHPGSRGHRPDGGQAHAHPAGRGTAPSPPSRFSRRGADSRNPVLCDFDHNGAVDIAVANAGTQQRRGPAGVGEPRLHRGLNVGTDNGPAGAISGDISLDGFCDVVTANEERQRLDPDGRGLGNSLGAPTIPTGTAPLGARPRISTATGGSISPSRTATTTASRSSAATERGGCSSRRPRLWGAAWRDRRRGLQPDGAPDLVVTNQGLVSDSQRRHHQRLLQRHGGRSSTSTLWPSRTSRST